MGKASRIKRRALKSQKRVRRGGGSYGYYAAVVGVCVVGISLIAVSKASESDAEYPRAGKDHWHIAIGFNDCGEWLDGGVALPENHERAKNTNLQAGLHSHGDGLMHFHPWQADEAGKNATVGNFMEFGGWDVSRNGFSVGFPGPAIERNNGEMCGDGDKAKEGVLRWTVDDKEQKGNPSKYRPNDQETIAFYFVSADQDLKELGEVPSKANLEHPIDDAQSSVGTGSTTTTSVGGASTSAPPHDSSDDATTVPSEASVPAETTVPETVAP